MAAEPPPLRPEDEPSSAQEPSRTRKRQRTLIARFVVDSPLPAAEIVEPADRLPESSAPRPEAPTVPWPILDGTLAFAVLGLAALLASFAAVNADLWLHLAAGRRVAQGQFPSGGDPFSAAAGATWVNHSWLYDLFQYLIYRPGGTALVAVKAGLVVLLAAILLAMRRRPTSGGLAPALATTLVLLAASPQFVLRSAVVSYLLFGVLLFVLHRGFWTPRAESEIPHDDDDPSLRASRGSRWKLPLTIGLLFLIWVNIDGGFVFGLLLLAAWTLGAVLQPLYILGDTTDEPGEASHPPMVLVYALVAALAASLINPHHIHAFRLPAELVQFTMPAEVQREKYFEAYFQDQMYVSLLDPIYRNRAGDAATFAAYLLLGLSVASFAVNVGGWRWRRAFAWMLFAYLGLTFGRLVPYMALVCGPVIALNFQAFLARRRIVWADNANPRADHLRRMCAGMARTGLLLTLFGLLFLAWPGWLGPEARTATPPRRVAWRAVPDPTMERLAKRLKGWYDAGDLREGEARGFHYPPAFSNYCAWFCPAEKGVFDARLTAPPEAIADYLALRRTIFGMGIAQGPEHPEPPEQWLRKGGITHLVMSGPAVLHQPPEITGYGVTLFVNSHHFPLWAIDGRGIICGWRDAYPKLRLSPVRRAVGDKVEPLPPEAPAIAATPVSPSIWERYVAAPAPIPPETYEAGLWLGYKTATGARSEVAIRIARIVGLSAGRATFGLPDLGVPVLSEFMPHQIVVPLEAAWLRSAEGRSGRAASLLAVRAARRAIRVNSADPEAYVRLAQAYANMDTDAIIGPYQRIAAIRQALARLAVATHRPSILREELALQEQLSGLYQQMVVPGTQTQPLDLLLQSQNRVVELYALVGPAPNTDPADFEANLRKQRATLEPWRAKIRGNLDNWENAAANAPPPGRAAIACRYGLAGEALKVLREADPKELDAGSALMMANLALLTGEAENAKDWLAQIEAAAPDRSSLEFRLRLHMLAAQAAAALGDYRSAIDHSDALLDLLSFPVEPAARAIANLVLPDSAPFQPLTRIANMPLWAGLWRQDQVAIVNRTPLVGELYQLTDFAKNRNDWLVLQGMLALEQGDIPLARKRLSEEAQSRFNFSGRALAARWLELMTPAR